MSHASLRSSCRRPDGQKDIRLGHPGNKLDRRWLNGACNCDIVFDQSLEHKTADGLFDKDDMGPECGNVSHEIGKVLLLLVDERIKVHVLTLDAVELEWEGHKHYPGVTAVRAICLCATFLVMTAPSTYSES